MKNNHTCTQNNILSVKYLQMNWERYTHVHTRHQLFLSPPSLIPLFSLFNISPKRSHGALSTPLLMYFLCPQIQLVAVKFSCSQSPGVWMLYLSRFFAALKMEYSLYWVPMLGSPFSLRPQQNTFSFYTVQIQ